MKNLIVKLSFLHFSYTIGDFQPCIIYTNPPDQIFINCQHVLQRSESHLHIKLCELRLSICS